MNKLFWFKIKSNHIFYLTQYMQTIIIPRNNLKIIDTFHCFFTLSYCVFYVTVPLNSN